MYTTATIKQNLLNMPQEQHKADTMGIQSEPNDLRNLVTTHNLKIMCRSWLLELWSTQLKHRRHTGERKTVDSTQTH